LRGRLGGGGRDLLQVVEREREQNDGKTVSLRERQRGREAWRWGRDLLQVVQRHAPLL
jgi:hypothetical protein